MNRVMYPRFWKPFLYRNFMVFTFRATGPMLRYFAPFFLASETTVSISFVPIRLRQYGLLTMSGSISVSSSFNISPTSPTILESYTATHSWSGPTVAKCLSK